MATAPHPLRALPAVGALLEHPGLARALAELPRSVVVEAIRETLAEERTRLKGRRAVAADSGALAERASARAFESARPQLRRVINATGIVLHTNLGRAPLSVAAQAAVADVARGYSSLEFDLETGKRGDRGTGVERWLCRLTGAGAAVVVNNGAAAVLLALSALASGKQVLVSRGELIEIGGSFRVPEVMEKSGATLLEVGTTNRTHLRDYERALARHDDVGAILRVHPSNFRVEGFTKRVALAELSALARRHKVPLIEDLGSGALVNLGTLGLEAEPTVRESLTEGSDIVTFSGDKLLGASQAGLILGKKRLVDRVRRDPLARALRLDKLALAALEASLPAYADLARAASEVPTLAMLSIEPGALERKARRLAEALARRAEGLSVQVAEGAGEVGGGALPLQKLPGWVVTIESRSAGADALDARARAASPPVVGYVRAGKLRLDVRTIADAEINEAAEALARAFRDDDAGH